MCRYPAPSAARTASRVSSGGVWKTPSPRAGISTPLLRVMIVVGALMPFPFLFLLSFVPCRTPRAVGVYRLWRARRFADGAILAGVVAGALGARAAGWVVE